MKSLKQRIISHPFFQSMSPRHLEIMCECAREATFKTGETLFREGEPAGEFYLIEDGIVTLEAHKSMGHITNIQTLGAGEMVGWSWLFPPFTWHFQARVAEPTTVIVFNGGHLLAAAERDPKFGYDLMKRVSQVVIHRLQATRDRLKELQVDATVHH